MTVIDVMVGAGSGAGLRIVGAAGSDVFFFLGLATFSASWSQAGFLGRATFGFTGTVIGAVSVPGPVDAIGAVRTTALGPFLLPDNGFFRPAAGVVEVGAATVVVVVFAAGDNMGSVFLAENEGRTSTGGFLTGTPPPAVWHSGLIATTCCVALEGVGVTGRFVVLKIGLKIGAWGWVFGAASLVLTLALGRTLDDGRSNFTTLDSEMIFSKPSPLVAHNSS